IVLDSIAQRLEAAYRGDRYHALLRNIESVRPDEWDVRPAEWSAEVFGAQPQLSICDIAGHAGAAKHVYAARLSGDDALAWADIRVPAAREMPAVLTWLDEGHEALASALAGLADDADLMAERLSPSRRVLTAEQLLSLIINHDLYHAGEVNRQRALLRGADGWER